MSPRLPPGAHLVERARVGSTNAVARELAAAGAAAPTFVWAREQTAGRGRRGAGWVSPPGNLYVSTILRPACPAVTAMQLGFATAVAVAEAIETAGDLSAHVKWPNDVLLDARKVCGILLESSAAATGTLDWLVIGTGINVAHRPADLPEAASLADAGCEVAVDQLLEVLRRTPAALGRALVRRGFRSGPRRLAGARHRARRGDPGTPARP